MIYEIYTENGQKKKRALTGNGYGLPLGSIIAVYSNLVPDGYLPCNGAVYDTTTYAALYAYLGSNRLPDLRECGLVGAGQSDNDYNASTNPNGIHEHDVYAVGEFKDDQLQDHKHSAANGEYKVPSGASYGLATTSDSGGVKYARTGSTTHGKQVGVNYCIKATPAYVEPDTVSDMVNTLRTQDSYSTEEVNTGKKWIDGKPIYRKAGVYLNFSSVQIVDGILTSSYVDTVVMVGGCVSMPNNGDLLSLTGYVDAANRTMLNVQHTGLEFNTNVRGLDTSTGVKWWIEYTKTTD